MSRPPVPLESWEAVVPGLVLPVLALVLGGDGWSARALAASANAVPLAVTALLAWFGGRRTPAVQGAATFAYAIAAAGWIGSTWDVPGLQRVGDHAALWTPVVAAGVAVVVFLLVSLVPRSPEVGAPSPTEEV